MYSEVMKKMMNNKNCGNYVECKLNAEKKDNIEQIYDVPSIISRFVELYKERIEVS